MTPAKTKQSTRQPRKIHGRRDEALAELEVIFDNLRDLLSREYQRGGANAASRILTLVAANDGDRRAVSLEDNHPLKRAPRGAARQLVQKALSAGAKTIREIRDSAETEVERFLSYQTVRLELERGKAEKRYKKNKDKWSLG